MSTRIVLPLSCIKGTMAIIIVAWRSTTLTLASSHVPMLSQPDKVADFIIKAVTTLNAKSHVEETQVAAHANRCIL